MISTILFVLAVLIWIGVASALYLAIEQLPQPFARWWKQGLFWVAAAPVLIPFQVVSWLSKPDNWLVRALGDAAIWFKS